MLQTLIKISSGVLVAFFLSACATGISYDQYLERYHGMDEEQLVSIWGQPVHTFDTQTGLFLEADEDAEEKNLVFEQSREVNRMVSPAIYQPYYDGKIVRQRIVQAERWQRVTETCKTTFLMKNGRVSGWYHQGNGCISPSK